MLFMLNHVPAEQPRGGDIAARRGEPQDRILAAVVQFGGAGLLPGRLARTLAPPKEANGSGLLCQRMVGRASARAGHRKEMTIQKPRGSLAPAK